MLTVRMAEILRCIVDEFIQTAEPVGSKTLMTKYHLPYSSATIRNDMQYLEEVEYLEKPHTSSGRIPSTKAYQFYCENMMNNEMDKGLALSLKSLFDSNRFDFDEAIKHSCDVLAEMTNLVTGALGPDSSLERLEHIKLFPIDTRNAVCVFITNSGHTETKNFKFRKEVLLEDIETCCSILNSKLKNTLLEELAEKLNSIKPVLESKLYRHEMLFSAFLKAFIRFANDNVYYSNRANILYQPEYSDVERLKAMMSMLDDNDLWKGLSKSSETLALKTSEKTELQWLNDVAVVRSKFKVSEFEEGQMMIVGPSRMDYRKIISLLDYVTALIERNFGDGKE